MKDRGKAVEVYSNDFFQDYSISSDLPCKKHPESSSVGICAYCLKDRLVKLVCSDCGEPRLSSCSCSEISNPRTSCTVKVGSVGRISFLIENENKDQVLNPTTRKGGGLLDLDGGFSTANRRVFSLKESYFTSGDDSGFIDLKFDFQSESKGDIPALKKGVLSDSHSAFGSMSGGDYVPHESAGSFQNALVGDGTFCNGGSCRITVNERGIRKSRKNFRGWRWIFKHNPNWSSTRKKDGELMVNH
ncbi:hypothetical protein CRYUN_Cryun25bG0048100 [Craigia yunnanensis]